ncbi:hypothetical protein BCY88_06010 [Paraburkholderia fungorum]|uniref:Uncharacterized protein n=1 Tax=Paraburkholderia fungorum TaxID=134537 RepID=A0A420GEE6_9BURK|nr:hypothetical protein BCY88_06010 [Paraburkholderia fungorum]
MLTELNRLLAKATRAAQRSEFGVRSSEFGVRSSEFGRLTGEDAPLRAAFILIDTEMFRVGPIGSKGKRRPPARSTEGAAGFDFDPDDPADRAAFLIARSHQKRC